MSSTEVESKNKFVLGAVALFLLLICITFSANQITLVQESGMQDRVVVLDVQGMS